MQFQKISILPKTRDWNFRGGGGGVLSDQKCKEMKLNWNFQRGGVLEKIPSVAEVWVFSVTTQ